MADDMALAAMFEYYERGGEQGRLDEPAGQLEFARTRQIIARHLPPPPATVADIGGGPGGYSLWLAALGCRVLHRDVVPLHVGQLRRQAAGKVRIDSAVADARDPGLDPGRPAGAARILADAGDIARFPAPPHPQQRRGHALDRTLHRREPEEEDQIDGTSGAP